LSNFLPEGKEKGERKLAGDGIERKGHAAEMSFAATFL
jgi:hypothetical protein